MDPSIVERRPEERRPMGEQGVGDGCHGEDPAGEGQRERCGVAPALRLRGPCSPHGLWEGTTAPRADRIQAKFVRNPGPVDGGANVEGRSGMDPLLSAPRRVQSAGASLTLEGGGGTRNPPATPGASFHRLKPPELGSPPRMRSRLLAVLL